MTGTFTIATDHRCLLGDVTDQLAELAHEGKTGTALAREATSFLAGLTGGEFERCCLPAYLALAPSKFQTEVQLPIASADEARLDTRVLLWPVGARDGQHPHFDGWAAFITVRGDLVTFEDVDGDAQPSRGLPLGVPELLDPKDCVSHHIHNRGRDVGLTIHIFGI